MEQWTTVCSQKDLVPYLGVCALVEEKQIALFQVGDSLYAIDNYDPVSRANVLSRGIVGDLKGELVVASPVYKQHFSLLTGQCHEVPDIKLSVYPVQIQDGMVQVSSTPVTCDQAA